MNTELRILGIAPYQELERQLQDLAYEYPSIQLVTFVGDLEDGLHFVKNNFYHNYSAIISRGKTAQLIKQLPIPVIDIEITMYDILTTLKLSGAEKGKTAIVSYADFTSICNQINAALDYSIDVYTLPDASSAESILKACKTKGYTTILCDMVTNTMAQRLGMNSFLITSGKESIKNAINLAIETCNNISTLRNENLMLRTLIQGQISQTILFDEKENAILLSSDSASEELLDILKKEIPETKAAKTRKFIRTRKNLIWTIRGLQLESPDYSYTAFFFTERKTTLDNEKAGIQFFTRQEAEKEYYSSLFHYADTISYIKHPIQKVIKSEFPILISGEKGTGKESLVFNLFINSLRRNQSLVFIDCSLIDDKVMDFLAEHISSPLTFDDVTLYLHNLDSLTPYNASKLIVALHTMEVTSRNKVYFSCKTNENGHISKLGSMFADEFQCITISIPPLREQKVNIRSLIAKTVSYMNTSLSDKVINIEEEAINLLVEYDWPHNFIQFKRLMVELTAASSNSILRKEDVANAIQKEFNVGYISNADNSFKPIDLNRHLSEIEKDIIERVFKESNENQTETAKRLGISRTTLWRIMKS